MTYCIPDETPETWYKTEFQSRFMSKVCDYMNEHNPVVKLAGAISYNAMLEQRCMLLSGEEGRTMTIISFENEDEHDTFVEWYGVIEGENNPDNYAVVIADIIG